MTVNEISTEDWVPQHVQIRPVYPFLGTMDDQHRAAYAGR